MPQPYNSLTDSKKNSTTALYWTLKEATNEGNTYLVALIFGLAETEPFPIV